MHIEYLLKEAGIPQAMWHAEKLVKKTGVRRGTKYFAK